MKDIDKIYPSNVAKGLHMNHSRYIQKLYNPEEFSIKQLMDFAEIIDIDPQIIFAVIAKQLLSPRRR